MNISPLVDSLKSSNLRQGRRAQEITIPIERIEVINAVTDSKITDLSDQLVITLSDYGLTSPSQLNFNAVPAVPASGTGMLPVKSVRFALDDISNFRTENGSPYAACSNSGSDYNFCSTLVAKQYIMTATSWSGSSAAGVSGVPLQFNFTITLTPPPNRAPVSSPTVAPVSSPVQAPVLSPVSLSTLAPVPLRTIPIARIEVINAVTDTKIADLSDQLVITLSDYGLTSPTQLNFNAVPADPIAGSGLLPVKSVIFALDNKSNFRTENGAPYAACGNSGSDYALCSTLVEKQYVMTATSWSDSNAAGVAGVPLQFNFTIALTRPVSSPSLTPVISPITPVAAPVVTPMQPPMAAPVGQPVMAPVEGPIPQCSVPKLMGSWESYRSYPIPVAESQGAAFGDEFVLFGGFSTSYDVTTNRSFGLDLRNATSNQWVEKDPVPMNPGHSHAALASVGNTTYVCGGYVGGVPGPATDKCFVFEPNNPPGTQWRPFPSLPGPRAGAAMWYDKATNSLTFATGASRPNPSNRGFTVDHNDTWAFDLSNPAGGWVYKGTTPFQANHIGRVTFEYKGEEHHMMMGGQLDRREGDGNVDDVFELFANNHTWVRRMNMPFPRGHFSESSIPYKDCGFIIIAGAINSASGLARTSDISYYDYGTDTWTSIGNLSRALPTPVCLINNGYIYCQSGPVGSTFSVRRLII